LYDVQIDCVLITETWLSSHISDGQLDPRSEFNIMRKDRSDGRGGGVCIIIKKCFAIVPLTMSSKYGTTS